MYAGPGAGFLLAASAAWAELATDLYSAAALYRSVISELTAYAWAGPSSLSMAASVAPFLTWLAGTATQADHAAVQTRAAASAHEVAFAMTVPPAVIAANRAELASLTATNLLGQNTPAIMATEAQYAQMWAQDAAAMYGYASRSAAATELTPFSAPPAATNPAGQGAVLAEATGGGTLSAAPRLMSAVPQALRELTSPSASAPSLLEAGSYLDSMSAHVRTGASSMSFLTAALALMRSAHADEVAALAELHAVEAGLGAGALGSVGSAGLSAGSGGAAVAANMGRAVPVGALSTPQVWTSVAPVAQAEAATLSSVAADPAPHGGLVGVPPAAPAGGASGRGGVRPADAARFLPHPKMVPPWTTGG